MKMKKSVVLPVLAFTSILYLPATHAAHFTVGGSTSGDFAITGVITFSSVQGTESAQTIFANGTTDSSGGQTDTDTPADSPMPAIATWYGISTKSYACNAIMRGNVTNGAAQITSVSLSGTTSVCLKINASFGNKMPWKFHALSQPGVYPALLGGISFSAATIFNCNNIGALANVGGSYIGFEAPSGMGCQMYTAGNGATVSPALEVVFP